jgi:hypothetical protein
MQCEQEAISEQWPENDMHPTIAVGKIAGQFSPDQERVSDGHRNGRANEGEAKRPALILPQFFESVFHARLLALPVPAHYSATRELSKYDFVGANPPMRMPTEANQA